MTEAELRTIIYKCFVKHGFATNASLMGARYFAELLFTDANVLPPIQLSEELFLLSNVLKLASDEVIS